MMEKYRRAGLPVYDVRDYADISKSIAGTNYRIGLCLDFQRSISIPIVLL